MAENTNKNGLGVAGFVVSLVGFLLCLIPLIRIVGAIICGIGFILEANSGRYYDDNFGAQVHIQELQQLQT